MKVAIWIHAASGADAMNSQTANQGGITANRSLSSLIPAGGMRFAFWTSIVVAAAAVLRGGVDNAVADVQRADL